MERRELKILYHGAGLSGRKTNLEHIYSRNFDSKLKSFNYKPFKLSLDQVKHIVGKAHYNNSLTEYTFIFSTASMSRGNDPYREVLIKEMDAFVFIVDSQIERMDANIYALWETETILKKYNRNIADIPWVIQYNKRDLPNVVSISDLQKEFNYHKLPYFESIAYKGIGVFETFISFVNQLDQFYGIFD